MNDSLKNKNLLSNNNKSFGFVRFGLVKQDDYQPMKYKEKREESKCETARINPNKTSENLHGSQFKNMYKNIANKQQRQRKTTKLHTPHVFALKKLHLTRFMILYGQVQCFMIAI